MSLFSSLNRDFSKDRDFGREVSSVGDVSSMKSKTVCAFYCFNFALFFLGLYVPFTFLGFSTGTLARNLKPAKEH